MTPIQKYTALQIQVMPMRFLPHYFDKTKEQNKKNEGMDADDYEAKSQLQAVQVHIKRRETEQQQEARLRSYAYLTQQEDSERWLELKYKGCGDKASKGTATKYSTTLRGTRNANQLVLQCRYLCCCHGFSTV